MTFREYLSSIYILLAIPFACAGCFVGIILGTIFEKENQAYKERKKAEKREVRSAKYNQK